MNSVSFFRRGFQVAALMGLVFWAGSAWADSKNSAWINSAGQSYDHRNPRFRLNLSAQASVTIDLTSASDTYLYVLSQDGSQRLAADDDSGDGLNSRVTITLGAGKYLLIAATYSAGHKRDFTLSTNQGWLSYCFQAYTNAYYSGTVHNFCEGGSQPFSNDSYSSFRVPKGMQVRAYQHSNLVGIARTYYTDTPWVGSLYNDMISSFSWSDFAVNDFSMIYASDPQFSWGHCSDGESALCNQERSYFAGWSDEAISRRYNANLVAAMNTVKNHLGNGRFGGVVVNGDLTEYGDQGPDLGDYISTYEHGLNTNVYLGLGNHDYGTNVVNNCWENHCGSTMVWYLKDQASTLNPVSFDYWESGTYYKFPSYRRDHNGSLGYSWDIGNVHFVQLNNYATYTNSWNGWNFSAARRDYFNINSAMNWLRNDLATAKANGKKIVLNLHDWGAVRYNAEFQAVLNDYPVSAVNAGHWHGTYGRYEFKGPFADGKYMPVFLSGSAHFGTFLVTRYVGGKSYTWVMAVDHFNGARLRVLYNGTYYDASNLGSILNVCTGCARYYQDESSLR